MKITMNLKNLASKGMKNRIREIADHLPEATRQSEDSFELGEFSVVLEGSPEEIMSIMKESTDQLKLVMPSFDNIVNKGFDAFSSSLNIKKESSIQKIKNLEAQLQGKEDEIYNLNNEILVSRANK